MAGKIHRRKKSGDFVTLDTHCCRNKDLKWAAKGLHTYLMQLPEDWQINIADLENRSIDGRDATSSAMKALIEAGYVLRERVHNEKGLFEGYDYQLFERPEHAKEWLAVNGKSVNGLTVNGKPASNKDEGLVNTNSTKIEEEKEELREVEKLETVEEKPEQERGVPPAAAPPPIRVELHDKDIPGAVIIDEVPVANWRPFNFDEQAAALKADELCRDKFGRDMNLTLERANIDFPVFVDEFVAEQKAFCNTYNKTSDFRKHFYYWSLTAPKAKAAAKNRPAPGPASQQQQRYSTASPVPSNIRRL